MEELNLIAKALEGLQQVQKQHNEAMFDLMHKLGDLHERVIKLERWVSSSEAKHNELKGEQDE